MRVPAAIIAFLSVWVVCACVLPAAAGDWEERFRYHFAPYDEALFLDKVVLDRARKNILKEEIDSVMSALRRIERRSTSLDQFGRSTMAQAARILAIGPPAIPFLSRNLSDSSTRWRLRYWIADMLGYLQHPDAVRVLTRLRKNKAEHAKVREKARKSLEQLLTAR